MRSVAKPVFFYGTLRDRDVLQRVLGAKVARSRLFAAALEGCRAVYIRGRLYPTLIDDDGAEVQGVVLRDCHPREWTKLRHYEGPEYSVRELTVKVGATSLRACVFRTNRTLAPSRRRWCLDVWRRNHKRKYMAKMLAY